MLLSSLNSSRLSATFNNQIGTKVAKLKPRARIIRTIGDQLISGPEAAIIELVKNSYDADSASVRIKIRPDIPISQGAISIVDDGHGMSEDDVIDRWFEPATNEKAKRKVSPKGRVMLGAKGIGRFAAARLGDITRLRSWFMREGRCELTEVEVDWRKFTADAYLDNVDIAVNTHFTSESKTGVEITIANLRDSWTKARMERLIRELRRVASPSEVSDTFSMHLDISEFTKSKGGFDGRQLLIDNNRDYLSRDSDQVDPTVIVPFAVSSYSDYSLSGKFDAEGTFRGSFVNYRSDSTEIPIEIPSPENETGISCGPVQISINVYDREHDAVEALFLRAGLDFETIGIRMARKILTDNAGIAIFRDGFRIRPYGEPENDWLELERQRVQNPSKKLGLSQVSGRVYIADESTSSLVERSSREGLEHGDAFDRLKDLILNAISHLEERRVEFREKAGLSRKVSGDVQRTKSLAQLKRTRKEIERTPEPYASKLRDAIERDSSDLAISLDEISAYQKLLQSRAALGLVVSQVIHEARRLINPMASAARNLTEDSEHLLSTSKAGDVARTHLPHNIKTISDSVRSLSNLIKRLDPLSGRKRGKPVRFNAHEVISTSLGLMREEVASRGIRVRSSLDTQLWSLGYREDLQSAILNIFENAIHWSRAGGNLQPEIAIAAMILGDDVVIDISNNGPLIDPAYSSRLFDAGFSLKSDGTGLGLAIAREAARASRGEITQLEDREETTFRITFPTVG